MKVFRTNKGRGRNIIAASEWETIPEDEKRRLKAENKVEVYTSSYDLAQALAKAQEDMKKQFGR